MFDKLLNIKILGEYVIYHSILRKGLGLYVRESVKIMVKWLDS